MRARLTLIACFLVPRAMARRFMLHAVAYNWGIWPVPWWWWNGRIARAIKKRGERMEAPWRVTME